MLRSHDRFPYSPIIRRPEFSWPDGRRLAIHVSLNLEHFSYGEGLGISWSPGIPHPNTYNWAWREYGNRVGVWRLLELFDEFKLPISLLLNSEVYDHCPGSGRRLPRARRRGRRARSHQLRASERFRRGRRDEADRRRHRRDRAPRRQEADRLAEPRRQSEQRHARPPSGGRLSLHPRLADGRPAGVDAHPQGTHPLACLIRRR